MGGDMKGGGTMFRLLKERIVEWVIILVLLGVCGLFVYNTLQTQDIRLINKEATETVDWCEGNIDGCSVCRNTSADYLDR